VSHRPPSAFDRGELGALGTFVPLASFLRKAGEFPVYATLCALFLAFGLVRRRWLGAALITIVEMLVTWKVSDAFKLFFDRPRPPIWFAVHEPSASYASGHATLSLAFYGFIAWLVWASPLAPALKRAVAALALVWIGAIGWSRLALGAHYPTDVLGGYALGAAAVCFAIVAYHASIERFSASKTFA